MKAPILSLVALLVCSVGFSQVKKLNNNNSKISVSGTSSLHDWTMTMDQVSGQGAFKLEGNTIQSISDVSITLKVEGLKSGKSGMDKNAYKAMETGKYPNMVYKSSKNAIAGNKVTSTGQLTLANTTKTVVLNLTCSATGNTVKCTGKLPIKMTDYGIKPPTAMMGTIKTGDALTIDITASFQ